MSTSSTDQHPLPASVSPILRSSDRLGRLLRDLRISVTDRCNFRCAYCMPRQVFGASYPFLPKKELLSSEEISRVTKVFTSAGVTKVRLTGGEPLLRADLEKLVGMLSENTQIADLALTTNGVLLAQKADALMAAGLRRITVSIDALNPVVFRQMSDSVIDVETVLRGIESAQRSGFNPVRVNMVVRRGVNEQEVVPMAQYFSEVGCVLRFIEYMDVGTTNGWRLSEVVSAREILDVLEAEFGVDSLPQRQGGDTAKRYRLRKTGGEIGVIASVTEPFCRGCTRGRLTASGKLHTCLFGDSVLDVKALMRDGCSDAELFERITDVWRTRVDRYSEQRFGLKDAPRKAEMSVLGG